MDMYWNGCGHVILIVIKIVGVQWPDEGGC